MHFALYNGFQAQARLDGIGFAHNQEGMSGAQQAALHPGITRAGSVSLLDSRLRPDSRSH
jgi:hypothetical protein